MSTSTVAGPSNLPAAEDECLLPGWLVQERADESRFKQMLENRKRQLEDEPSNLDSDEDDLDDEDDKNNNEQAGEGHAPPKKKQKQRERKPLLPPPTKTHLVLRITKLRFKTFRVVRLPANYTFDHLHKLILKVLSLGSGSHLHEFTVVHPAERYKSKGREGEIKRQRYDEDQPWQIGCVSKSSTGDGEKYFGRPFPTMKYSPEITLGKVWNPETGLVKGKWRNEDVGAAYIYDFGSSWNVDIVFERVETTDEPTNEPYFIEARNEGQKAKDHTNHCARYNTVGWFESYSNRGRGYFLPTSFYRGPSW
ncbi:hypothetical protein RUND412_002775 [Rhizina undulata]